MNKYYKMLDFETIISKIAKNFKTKKGIELFQKSDLYKDYEKFSSERKLYEQYFNYSIVYGYISFVEMEDISLILKYFEKNGNVSIENIKEIYNLIINTKISNDYFTSLKNEKELIALLEKTSNLSSLKDKINSIFDKEFNVKDSASDNLLSIRIKIKTNENLLKDKILDELNRYSVYLNSNNYLFKNSTYVLPFKTSYKNKINGMIVDISDSGETTFIVPSSCIEINNKIYNLKKEETNEIKRILSDLGKFILTYKNELINNEYVISKIDLINSKCIYGFSINGNYIPTLNNSHINLIDAIHPLLNNSVIISNSLLMEESKRQLIISGPNAGGKTVFLKMVGLLILMNQFNIPIPCNKDSSLGFFKNIFIEIGDSQSIESNLSTFSSHIINIKNILNAVKKNDLVLIDELGNGTDPKEGESLALAICKYLKDSECKSLITSHFNLLKSYSLTSGSVLCGSMVFDEKNIVPTYKFILNLPGKSYGISIAKQIGLKKDVVNEANKILSTQEKSKIDKDISILTNEILNYQKLIQETKNKSENLDKEINKYRKNNEVLQGKLKKFDSEIEAQKEKIIDDFKNKLDKIKNDLLSKNSLKLNEAIEINKQVDDLIDSNKNDGNSLKKNTFKIGDHVKSDDFNIEGDIFNIKSNGDCLIKTDGGKTYTISYLKLELTKKIVVKEKKEKTVDFKILNSFSSELNLLGCTRYEAREKLAYFLQEANANNVKRVRVIHGFGTGVVRNEVIDYLKKCSLVESFSFANQFEGGYGATIVILK